MITLNYEPHARVSQRTADVLMLGLLLGVRDQAELKADETVRLALVALRSFRIATSARLFREAYRMRVVWGIVAAQVVELERKIETGDAS